LRRALAPDSDSVIYREQVIHVAAWAARFLFTGEQLNQRVGRLSGGERARVLIAQLMLERAAVLLLDEPTNDLDIPTLEILEESLLDYPGAVVLVTHDRYLLDRLSTVVLGLDGKGRGERFADFLQWEAWLQARLEEGKEIRAEKIAGASRRPPAGAGGAAVNSAAGKPNDAKKKISYKEAQELASIEQRIADAERELQAKHDSLLDPAVLNESQQLRLVSLELEQAQQTVELLYARWAELEQKQN
jgi:ATP-binding cassette subfamily F protein uup